jgi:hypothetical protein
LRGNDDNKKQLAWTFAAALGAAAGLWLASSAFAADEKELVIGDQCDRTGPTQIVGTVLCPAMQDYYALVNSQGGVEGWKIRGDEIDNLQGAARDRSL